MPVYILLPIATAVNNHCAVIGVWVVFLVFVVADRSVPRCK